jgi:microcystin degradation protein MlrC
VRLFLASIFQETNVFSPIPTTLESFNPFWSGGHTPPDGVDLLGYGGAWDRAKSIGLDVHASLFASATPAAPISRDDWNMLKHKVLRDVRSCNPDMVFLFLHGAQSAKGLGDCEGDLLAEMRNIVGANIPIAVELDLHANLSSAMLHAADIITACKEYPHTDFAEVGARTLDLLVAAAQGRIRPKMAAVRVPMIAFAPTTIEPVSTFVAELRAAEEQKDILAASALFGFFGADSPDAAAAVIVISDGDQALAESQALHLANAQAKAVQALPQMGVGIDAALDAALNFSGTAIIADRADNPGGGAAGDSTWLLHAMLERGIGNAALGLIWDAETVALAHKAGIGSKIAVTLGGKAGPLSGKPWQGSVTIKALADAICQRRFGVGLPTLPIGRSAAFIIEGIDVVVCDRRMQVFSQEIFTGHGIDPAARDIVVVKSTQHFYRDFSSLGPVIYCDAPGTVTEDLASLPYRSLRRPLYPLDSDAIIPVPFPTTGQSAFADRVIVPRNP